MKTTHNLQRFRFQFFALAILATLLGPIASRAQETTAAQSQKKEIPPATAAEIRVLEKFLESHPDDPAALFNLALDEASIGENQRALALLEKMADAHTGLDPQGGAFRAFKALATDPRFVALVAQIEKENPPIVRSATAWTLRERDLAPEGIAYDPSEKVFYVSSMSKHKIVRLAADGTFRDFTTPRQEGLGATLGMKVDARRRFLWATSDHFNGDPNTRRFALYQYDLKTGALRFKHESAEGAEGFLNDVVLDSNGEAFTTNTTTGEVFRASPDRDNLEPFLARDTVGQANGIAISPNGKVLFVAGWLGVARVDVASRKFQLLAKPHNVSDAGLDGLYFYNGSLVGIQNPDLHPARVVRYFLDPALDAITRAEVLESYNPLFEIPTTGAIAGDSLYFMANTQIEKLGSDEKMPPLDQLNDILILKLKL